MHAPNAAPEDASPPAAASAPPVPPVPPVPLRAPGVRAILRFALPLMLSLMTSAVNGLVDTLFVSRLGTAPLAAVPLATMCYMVGWLLCVGLMRNAIAFCSRAYGAGRPQDIGPILAHYHVLVLAALPVLVGYVLAWPHLAAQAGLDAQVSALARTYLFIRVADVPFSLLVVLYSAFYQSIGNSRLPLLVSTSVMCVNVVLDYGLIFGHWGLPALGVAGSALATVLAQAAGAAFILALSYRARTRRRFALRPVVPLRRPLLKDILRVGVPAGVGDCVEVLVWSGFLLLIGRLGQASLAASNIAFQVTAPLFMPGFALGIAGASYIGRFLGAGLPAVARATAQRMLNLAVVYMALLGVPLWFFGEALARLFTADPQVVAQAGLVFKVTAVYQVFDAMGFVVRTALGGAGDTRVPTLWHVGAAVLVLFPGTLLGMRLVQPPVLGAWLGAFAFLIVYAVAMQWRFRGGAWMRMRLTTR